MPSFLKRLIHRLERLTRGHTELHNKDDDGNEIELESLSDSLLGDYCSPNVKNQCKQSSTELEG